MDRFYSDRSKGPKPRQGEVLPLTAKDGLISLFMNKLEANWFAASFPENCHDGNGVTGTNTHAVIANVRAVVPSFEWPPRGARAVEDETVFDLIEYASDHVQLPENAKWHDYFNHYELSFDRSAGEQQFRTEVNQIFYRGGTVFELNFNNRIERHGVPETLKALSLLRPHTGDVALDDLVERGRSGYLSHRPSDRHSARDALWDAFERLKTVEAGKDKKSKVETLLSYVSSDEFRDVINSDMVALTEVGNQFMIRHHETNKLSVPPEADDYLVGRISLLIGFLLDLRAGQDSL